MCTRTRRTSRKPRVASRTTERRAGRWAGRWALFLASRTLSQSLSLSLALSLCLELVRAAAHRHSRVFALFEFVQFVSFPLVTCTFYDMFFTHARKNDVPYTHTCDRCGMKRECVCCLLVLDSVTCTPQVYDNLKWERGKHVSNCHRKDGVECVQTHAREARSCPKLLTESSSIESP